jgi:WD40 repeat protein
MKVFFFTSWRMRILMTSVALLVGTSSLPAQEPKLIRQLKGGLNDYFFELGNIAVSTNGKLLASGGQSGNYLWDVTTGKVKVELKGHDGKAVLAFSSDGRHLAAGYHDQVIIWDLKTLKQSKAISLAGTHSLAETYVVGLALSPDYLAVGMLDASVLLFDRASFKHVYTFVLPDELGRSAAKLKTLRFDANGTRLVMGLVHMDTHAGREVLRVVDVRKKRQVVTIVDRPNEQSEWPRAGLLDVAISADGKMVAAVGCHGHVKVWEVGSGKLRAELGTRRGPPPDARLVSPAFLYNVAFSSDGKQIMAPDCWGTVWIWNIATKKVAHKIDHKFKSKDGHFLGLTCSPEGRFIATYSEGDVFVWDLKPQKK